MYQLNRQKEIDRMLYLRLIDIEFEKYKNDSYLYQQLIIMNYNIKDNSYIKEHLTEYVKLNIYDAYDAFKKMMQHKIINIHKYYIYSDLIEIIFGSILFDDDMIKEFSLKNNDINIDYIEYETINIYDTMKKKQELTRINSIQILNSLALIKNFNKKKYNSLIGKLKKVGIDTPYGKYQLDIFSKDGKMDEYINLLNLFNNII